MIFETVFGQFGIDFWTVCVVVVFLCVIVKKFELHVGCVKIMLMHAYGCIVMEFMTDENYV